jgi:hypothetical protein
MGTCFAKITPQGAARRNSTALPDELALRLRFEVSRMTSSKLFIGFSFRDRWVNGLLRRLNEEREERTPRDRLYHYALMKREEVQSKEESFFAELGVKPIALNDFDEIPLLLGHLYQQALVHDYGGNEVELPIVEKQTGKRTGGHVYLSSDQCWKHLCACRNRAVRQRSQTRSVTLPAHSRF